MMRYRAGADPARSTHVVWRDCGAFSACWPWMTGMEQVWFFPASSRPTALQEAAAERAIWRSHQRYAISETSTALQKSNGCRLVSPHSDWS